MNEQLDQKMSAKAIHAFLIANRHDIWSALHLRNVQSDDSSVKSDCEEIDVTHNQHHEQMFIIDILLEKWTLGLERLSTRINGGMTRSSKPSLKSSGRG